MSQQRCSWLHRAERLAYDESAFRWAFAMQYPMWVLGIVQVLRYRHRARAPLVERDPAVYDALRRGVALVPSG